MTSPNQTFLERIQRLPSVVNQLGFSELRDFQVAPIQRTLSEVDQFVVLPTGGGKSACYIVPTLCCGFKTLIFFPLVALIKDQLEGLLSKGLRAAAISSLYQPGENARALRDWNMGELDFLLVAPERLDNEEFMRAMSVQPPDMVVVDEIHVASEHGFNFRPAYRKIAPFVCQLNPRVFLGLTATMSRNVEEDLRLIFNAQDTVKTVSYYERTNLKMESRLWSSVHDLLRCVNEIEGSTIIYFTTKKRLEDAYKAIGKLVKGGACVFHGTLSPGTKDSNQSMFMDGSVRVVFATNSFGMGVDKADVRSVVYADIPGSLEEISQGFGRAGRDFKDSSCIFFWNDSTLSTQDFFIEIGYPSKANVAAYYNAIRLRLNDQGVCTLPLRDICSVARVNEAYAGAIQSILLGEGVIERIKLDESLRVKPLGEAKTKATQRILDGIVKHGVRNEVDGFYEVDIEFLASELETTEATILRNVRTLEEAAIIAASIPKTTSPIRVLKSMNEIDFAKLEQRRNDAIRYLKQVKVFWQTPDDQKHQMLKTHFTEENDQRN